MKYKYYATINGKEELVRTSIKNHFKYCCAGLHTFRATKEEVINALRSEAFSGYNSSKKNGIYIDDENGKYKLITKGEQYDTLLEGIKQRAEQLYNKWVSLIVEVYIK